MKSTKRWYFPPSLDQQTRVSMELVLVIVAGLCLLLAHEGGTARRLEKENELLQKTLKILDNQNENMEQGLLHCANGTSIRMEFPNTNDFVDVKCSRIATSVWDTPNKRTKRK